MDPNFWQKYAVGGATRPDSFSGMDPNFNSALQQLFTDAPPDIQPHLRVKSGYRSVERQAQLWQEAVRKYGSPEAARKWVAPPGNSQHNHGFASDLQYGNDAARQWAHQNASKYGLSFPLSNEDWHVELAGARDGHRPAPSAQQPVAAITPQPDPSQNLSSIYAQVPATPGMPGMPTPDVNPLAVADASPLGLGALFMQQQVDKRKQRQEEADAEATRKAALFGGSLYG